MTHKQKVIIGVLTLIMVGILSIIILQDSGKGFKKKKKATHIKYVKTLTVQNDTLGQWIKAHGRVISSHEINISAEVSGLLMVGNVALRQGTSFQKGAVLFRIYSDDFKYQVKAKRANFINLMAGALPDLKVDFKESYQKWDDFYRSIDVDQNLPPLPKIESTKEKTFMASRKILTDYYTIKSDEGRLEKYVIRAPFSGTFETVFAEPGATVNPGMNIARIIQSNELEIKVPLSIAGAKKIELNAKAKMYSNSANQFFTGKVVRKQESINANTQTLDVFIKLAESEDVFPGQYYNVEIYGGSALNSFKIPRRAFNNSGELMVIKDSTMMAISPEILYTSRDSVIVTGLVDGMLVVNEPVEYVSVNTKVAPIQ
jgi:multidrug efflux pump subunit AcrA (membrane-fusion protein)